MTMPAIDTYSFVLGATIGVAFILVLLALTCRFEE